MMENKRLIDAKDVYALFASSGFARLHVTDIGTIQRVNAIEVVRCKDCKWAEYGKDYEPYCNHWKSGLYANIKDDDFCSYGERMTSDEIN